MARSSIPVLGAHRLDESAPLEECRRAGVVCGRSAQQARLAQRPGAARELGEERRADAAAAGAREDGDLDVLLVLLEREGIAGEQGCTRGRAVQVGDEVDVVGLRGAHEDHLLRIVGIVRMNGIAHGRPGGEAFDAGRRPDLHRGHPRIVPRLAGIA